MDTRAAGGEGERSRETETGGEVMMGYLEVNQRKRVLLQTELRESIQGSSK